MLLCGFEREQGRAVDLFEMQRAPLVAAIKSVHPDLGLSELARLSERMKQMSPELFTELREHFFQEYGLRWSDRLRDILPLLTSTPTAFQNWVDDKKLSPRDLSVLLVVKDLPSFFPFLLAMTEMGFSRSEGVRALEFGAELFLMGRPINDLLPSSGKAGPYLQQLERWRRPQTSQGDEQWRETVSRWPWPSQVQGKWQRFGDQSGLEIQIRSTSPQDLRKKLERIITIGNSWHDRSSEQ